MLVNVCIYATEYDIKLNLTKSVYPVQIGDMILHTMFACLCDKSPTKGTFLSNFDNFEIFSASKVLNKLSNDTNLLKIEP